MPGPGSHAMTPARALHEPGLALALHSSSRSNLKCSQPTVTGQPLRSVSTKLSARARVST
eukprot:2333477-Rhodomonas_salina.1